MPDKKKKDDRLKIEDHTQSHSSNTGAATVAAGAAGLYGSKKLFDLGKPVVSRGVNASMDAAKTFKDKGLKGAWKDVKASMSKQLTPKGKNLPSIYVSTAADNIGLKHTGEGHGRALPKSKPDYPKVSRSAYNKPHNLQMYDDLASKVGPSNVVPGPSGTPQLGSVTRRGQDINYGQVRREGFLETNRMQNKIQKIEMNLAKDLSRAESKYTSKGFGAVDELGGGGTKPKMTHSNKGNPLPTEQQMRATKLDKAYDSAFNKAKLSVNKELDVTINKAMGHNRGGTKLTRGTTIGGSATSANVNINMQQYNPGIAGGNQTTPQSIEGVNPNKGPAGSTNLSKPGKGKIASKSVQLLGGKAMIGIAGAKVLPGVGNAMMAADVAGVSYKTVGEIAAAKGPKAKMQAYGKAGGEIVSTWKSRGAKFKKFTQDNMERSRNRKAQIRKDIYGTKKK
jgi:hypothetical protein